MTRTLSIGIVGILIFGCLISLITLQTDNVLAEDWNIQDVDSGDQKGQWNSIALDSNDIPHISYYQSWADNNIFYAKWTGSEWSTEIVDNGVFGSSIAVDSNDLPHISYQNLSNNDLLYAMWTGSTWDIQIVDSEGSVGVYASLELDSNDFPHISYMERQSISNAKLKYAKWNGTGWENETVDNAANVGYFCDMTLDSNDYPHISYNDHNGEDLKYAMWNGTGWEIDVVDNSVGERSVSSIDVNSTGVPHIAYQESGNDDLKYAKWNVSKCYVETLEGSGGGWSVAIEIDQNDNPHISFAKETASSISLRYMSWNGTVWKKKTIESVSNDGGWYETSIAIDSLGAPHISFYEAIGDYLKYAHYGAFDKPSAPQNLQTVSGNSYVNLTWEPPLDDGNSTITNYNVYRQGPPDSYFVFLEAVGNVLFYNDTDVINDGLYAYQVRAENGVGEGEWSQEVNATPTASSVPSSPQNLEASAGDGQITLTWDAPSDDGGSPITNYNIYRGNTPESEEFHTELQNVTSYTDSGLTNDQTYYYKITAVNGVGEGAFSNEVSATPSAEITINPPTLSDPGSEDDDGIFTVSWTDVADATSYVLEEDDNSGFSSPTSVYSGSDTSYQVSGKSEGTYYYRVKALVSSEESGWSNVESIVVVISDTDEDGLPDSWEQTHFGDLDQNPTDDYDKDGKTDLEEYQDGTDPTIAEVDDEEEELPILWILLIMIIIVVLLLIIMLKKKKSSASESGISQGTEGQIMSGESKDNEH
jgi:hypothetical protein